MTKRSFRLFHEANFFEPSQIFDNQITRNRTVFCGDSVANLLRVEQAVCKIQDLVGVFFAAAPQTFVAEDFGWGEAGGWRAIVYIVGAKDGDWAAWIGLAP